MDNYLDFSDCRTSVDRYLQDAAVNQVFKPWEITDNVSRLRIERANRSGAVRVLELVHKAAFRKGLGYSLYSPKWMLGNHSTEMVF
jgi:ubiquinol-cytochrome c reductase core subunit 2